MRPLGPQGLQFWRAVFEASDIPEPGRRQLLLLVCETIDRLGEVRAIIDRDGAARRTRKGARPHPLLQQETTLRAFVARALTRLGLDVDTYPFPRWGGMEQ